MSKPVFGYWNQRSYGQPIRYLLAYVGVDFEDKRYQVGPPPDFDKSCWFNEKYQLGFDFPNLPYYIEGDLKLTHSLAILRHLGKKHGLDGKTEEEKDKVDLMEQQSAEFRDQIVYLMHDQNFENLKDEYIKQLPAKLKMYSDFLGQNDWFAGNNITFPDFNMYEYLIYHVVLDANCLDQFENLKKYVERFEALEPIKKYLSSPSFVKWPLNNPYYNYGTAAHKCPI